MRKLDGQTAQRIASAINASAINELTAEPRPAGMTKLAGEIDLYRIRVGGYRIIYQIESRRLIVLVVTIGHRRGVYRQRRR